MSGEEGEKLEPSGGASSTGGGSRRRKHPLLLRILLDTNQLYTGSASDLLRSALRKLIEDSRSHQDIKIEWLLPEVVRWEREYQMTAAAKEFIPTLGKLERLLGHNLGISEEILSSRVPEVIDRQLRELGISTVQLEVASVDWQGIVQAAAFRKPPFEAGEKEKGFRDAVIAECFMRVIGESPKNPSTCRIAIVTGDGLLAETMEVRTEAAANVRILRTLDDLQSLINTLVSNVTEEFVASVRDTAQRYFFTEESKEGLFYKGEIRERLRQAFGEKLSELPKGATSRNNGTWYIGTPSFVEKTGQRIFWRTSIQVEATASKLESREPVGLGLAKPPVMSPALTIAGSTTSVFGSSEPLNIFASGPPTPPSVGILGTTGGTGLFSTREQVVVAKGYTLFHITWSVVITATKKLSHPKIEKIEWKETVWQ